MSRFNLLFWVINLSLCHALTQVKAQVFEKTAVLHGDSIVFPITLINAFPFISATVNGIPGKFMFDTGNRAAIDINDNYIKLANKKNRGDGIVASGQAFKKNINDTLQEVKFTNGITFRNLEHIVSANYDFLQNRITPDCLGYIGHDFFKGYIFKLDYLGRKLTFYKITAERNLSNDFLNGEKVLTTINFEIRKLVNHPLATMKIGGIDVLAAFDTGQYGSLQLDTPSADVLKRKGLVLGSGMDRGGNLLLTVKNIYIDKKLKVSLKGVEFSDYGDTKIIRKALGITEPNLIDIGYRFFSEYKTVWDYDKRKIYVMEY
ncbi:hypothetical protein [Pedobacter sp.]|uniref:hypothetical protein n=1 Tax=Pedobacter sp. TaxID=1411316 RepID=UPI003BAA1C6D